MAHSIKNKSKLVARIRRIKRQVEAVEHALEAEIGSADVLMLVASLRGAVQGLSSEVVEDHIRNQVVNRTVTPTRTCQRRCRIDRSFPHLSKMTPATVKLQTQQPFQFRLWSGQSVKV
jgi:DNA-binding FrmR family transcriptional regulator